MISGIIDLSGGYGEFAEGGLGNYNNFSATDDAMGEDKPAAPQPLSASLNRNGNRAGGGFGGGMSNAALQQELMWLKQDNHQIKGAVILLEKDRDNLRHAIRKLKVPLVYQVRTTKQKRESFEAIRTRLANKRSSLTWRKALIVNLFRWRTAA